MKNLKISPAQFFSTWKTKQTSTFTKKYVEKKIFAWLIANDWNMLSSAGALLLIARKGPTTINISCSGNDSVMRQTIIKDAQEYATSHGQHPVFIYGEQIDPRLSSYFRRGQDVVIEVSMIKVLNSMISELNPSKVGIIDKIVKAQILEGWVKLSPHGRATVVAFFESQEIGRCCADVFRSDLLREGDGKYGFKLDLGREFTMSQIYQNVVVKIYFNSNYIGNIDIWKDVIITNLSV
jgi:hypothetical protein